MAWRFRRDANEVEFRQLLMLRQIRSLDIYWIYGTGRKAIFLFF
jgi:hypothetical protein